METKEMIYAMLDDIESGNNADAQDKFNTLISQRVSDAMDAAKVEVASSIYGAQPNEEPAQS